MTAKQGWDKAEFRCGTCGLKIVTKTEKQYVNLISGHKAICGRPKPSAMDDLISLGEDGGINRAGAQELYGRIVAEALAVMAAIAPEESEVIEDSSMWSADTLNKPTGGWATHISGYSESLEEASRYAHHLVDKCGVAKTRVTRVRTIITVEEVYPA